MFAVLLILKYHSFVGIIINKHKHTHTTHAEVSIKVLWLKRFLSFLFVFLVLLLPIYPNYTIALSLLTLKVYLSVCVYVFSFYKYLLLFYVFLKKWWIAIKHANLVAVGCLLVIHSFKIANYTKRYKANWHGILLCTIYAHIRTVHTRTEHT